MYASLRAFNNNLYCCSSVDIEVDLAENVGQIFIKIQAVRAMSVEESIYNYYKSWILVYIMVFEKFD